MPRLGIVDLGSNTARLVVFEYERGRWYRLADEIREPIRLGQGLGADGRLTDAAMQRAEAVVHLFQDYARANRLDELEVIGTSALRDAENRQTLLDRLAPMGLPISVLSGEDEACLSISAIANSTAYEHAWVMDLGGGSVQMSRMQNRAFTEGAAYPLGAVRLTEGYLRSDPPSQRELTALEQTVGEHLQPLADRMREDGLPLVAMGGTIRNLARAVQRRRGYPLRLVHGYDLPRSALEKLTSRLLGAKGSRGRIAGINPDRADIITAGALVFRWLVRAANLPGLVVSGHGVRQGLFYRKFLQPPHLLPDVRRFHVQNLLERQAFFSENQAIPSVAVRLFDELQPLHGLGSSEREVLETAAKLRDIGKTVAYYRHHKHGYYMASTSMLAGFTHREQALVSLLIRYHRSGSPKLEELQQVCASGDKKRLATMVVCLRLAQALNRARIPRLRGLQLHTSETAVTIRLRSDHEPVIELWDARKHQAMFREVFGRRLVLEGELVEA